MIRLRPRDWVAVAHLMTETIPFVNINMAYQRCLPGVICVDQSPSPTAVLAMFGSDAWAWGDVSQPGVRKELSGFFGTIPDTPGLEQIVSEVWPELIRIPSIEYRFVGGQCISHQTPGYRLEQLTPENVRKTFSIWPDYAEQATIGHFLNYDDFFRHGYGFMVLDETSQECVSACAAISVSAQRADHGLDTVYAYEGLGLGTLCAQATVEAGLRRGLEPVWLAARGNVGSHRVATKLGFVPTREILLFERLR